MPEPRAISSYFFPMPADLYVSKPGGAPSTFATYSHYSEAIEPHDGFIHGVSRKWGDAPRSTQSEVVSTIINEAWSLGYSPLETAFALAVARTESGFNPDAAAATTSASGVGQFIDATGTAFGLSDENRFSTLDNVHAMLKHLQECIRAAVRKDETENPAQILETAYALYHDGPSLAYGGREIAEKTVIPWTNKFLAWLSRD